MFAHYLVKCPGKLNADLHQTYGIFDAIGGVKSGRYPILYVADLTAELPHDARIFVSENRDSAWTIEAQMLARISYMLESLIYGLAGAKGKKPKPVFPTTKRPGASANKNKIETETMDIESLTELIQLGMSGGLEAFVPE